MKTQAIKLAYILSKGNIQQISTDGNKAIYKFTPDGFTACWFEEISQEVTSIKTFINTVYFGLTY